MSQVIPRADNRALIVEAILREMIVAERWMTVELCWDALLKVNRMHADMKRELDRLTPDANAGTRELCAGTARSENTVLLACVECGEDFPLDHASQVICRPCTNGLMADELRAQQELEDAKLKQVPQEPARPAKEWTYASSMDMSHLPG